jgi:hypothetical protein
MKPSITCKIERIIAAAPMGKVFPIMLWRIGPMKGVVYSVPCRKRTATIAQVTKPITPVTREARAAMVVGMDLLKTTRPFTDTLGEDIMKFPLSLSVYFILILKH